MPELTAKQHETWEFFRDSDPIPSIRDACEHFGVNLNAMAGRLRALERKGYILKDRGHDGKAKARSMWIKGRSFVRVPEHPRTGDEIEISGHLYVLVRKEDWNPQGGLKCSF